MPAELTTLSGRPASRMGLGGSPSMEAGCVQAAFAGSVNWFFLYQMGFRGLVEGLAQLVRDHRDEVIVAAGTQERDPAAAAQALDDVRRQLGVDCVDVFFAEYLNPDDDLDDLLATGGLFDALEGWRQEGRVRYVGATCHDRKLGTRLAACGRVEVLMHRYNMAHVGAEEAVLPAALHHGVPVVAFTCTRWGSLLAGHRGWDGELPTAADCYRFALAHPAVRLVLTAPRKKGQMQENLAALAAAPPSEKEMRRWRRYGRLVYGDGMDAFETQWP